MWDTIVQRLKDAGIADPRREARLLMKVVTGVDPLLSSSFRRKSESIDPVLQRDDDFLEQAIVQRCARVPLSKIIGKREFYGRDFIVNDHVLDPRPDSETLIEATLKILPDKACILDLGIGSGCILLTLLAERPDCTGVGVDVSPEALSVARANAKTLGIDRAHFVESDFLTYDGTGFDVVVSNPPYIPSNDIAGLESEVRDHDPILALDGGADGCDPYRVIFTRLPEFLSAKGHFLVEIGFDICDKVTQLAMDAGHTDITKIKDLAGHIRVISGRCG